MQSSVPRMVIQPSGPLHGTVAVNGAKNSVLVSIASLLLAPGISTLRNVPANNDVKTMIDLMRTLGAQVSFDAVCGLLTVDTSTVCSIEVDAMIMRKMRASVLVMGPLLARFGAARVALPGGCTIGERPVDYHLKNFQHMGVKISQDGDFVQASAERLHGTSLVLAYPSVGATENLVMAATLAQGKTTIINAAIEPEVLALIKLLQQMGAHISVVAPATIIVEGVTQLQPIVADIIPDRLEAGALLLAAAITGGSVTVANADARDMDVFLLKLYEMGHTLSLGTNGIGVTLTATTNPVATSFKTGPYPSFPTDLQATTMAALAVAQGVSKIDETVFENRMMHVPYLQAMGASIVSDARHAVVTGVSRLYGAEVVATDIRASCALVLAGMIAEGTTVMTGLHHWYRGYDQLEVKLMQLGARLWIEPAVAEAPVIVQATQVTL